MGVRRWLGSWPAACSYTVPAAAGIDGEKVGDGGKRRVGKEAEIIEQP